MKTCPKLIHTTKGRKDALLFVEGLSKLESDGKYTYKLYHQYDSQPSDIYVHTSINPSVFELLLSRILFEAAEIDECYALGQEEIAQPILNGLYNIEIIEPTQKYDYGFDLYYVWEKWCALFKNVMNLKVLERDNLKDELEKIIPSEY